MDILIGFTLGNLAKFCAHLFFPYEEITLLIAMPIACITIYFVTKKRYITSFFAALGFAGHESLFASIGESMGLMYQQYPLERFVETFAFFLLLQVIINFILHIGIGVVAKFRQPLIK